ncbi:hypothetical protein FEM48_Zijuj05G0005400 [Ziziphus jujuba var. spinosa]|uniref:Uncharacterized protein n=1 Tax=Ziziphus jujuba var. spinosa TaxID=714518 RepID=A0A978VBR7_ZIZJJ|nr:hypothetical protein FEM48_Zijuj05G0005400 [Ziziphus jujuba var. spinosa]
MHSVTVFGSWDGVVSGCMGHVAFTGTWPTLGALGYPEAPFHQAYKAAEALRKELFFMVGERKENLASYSVSPTQDVLSQMIAESAGEDGFMSEVEIADKILIYSSQLSLASVSFLRMRFSLLTEQAEIRRLMMPREVG